MLITQLELDESRDTISKWMANYIAEKMDLAEHGSGQERKLAQKECSEAIIMLWNHRWNLPKGKRPLERFDKIFDVLNSLRQERMHPLYFQKELDLQDVVDNEWLKITYDIDKGARTAILLALHQATVQENTQASGDFLNYAPRNEKEKDLLIIDELLSPEPEGFDDNEDIDLEQGYSANFKRRYLKGQLSEVQSAKKHLMKLEKQLLAKLSSL